MEFVIVRSEVTIALHLLVRQWVREGNEREKKEEEVEGEEREK